MDWPTVTLILGISGGLMASLTKILSKPGVSDGLGDMERRLIVIETEMPYLKDGVKRVETKMDRVLSILDSRDNKA